MGIQAVLFDMGGTIETYDCTRDLRLKRTPGIQQRLLAAGIDLGLSNEALYDVVTAGLNEYHTWCLQSWEELPSARVWSEYILRGYPIDQNALAAIAEYLMCYIETRYYHRAMREEMPVVLEEIRKMGLKIALISNVNSFGQVPTNLTAYNIKHYFDPIVLSSEYGRRKPDPAIFHYAARLANVPASKCLYVGDRITRDILGARKAGYGLAVQIKHNFDHGEIDEGPAPDFVINQMTELLDILKSANAHLLPAEPAPGQIRALLFDAGDLLYYRAEKHRYFTEFLTGLGINPGDDHAAEKFKLRQIAYRGELDQVCYRKAILQLYGIDQPELIERGLEVLKTDDDNVQFFEGVKETLIALKNRGFLLGILTDTANPMYVKLSWFEKGGFGHVWDSIISSMDVGVRKPDAKIYNAALNQLGVTTDECLFVGHKVSELEGARVVGLKTIAFNYDDGAAADYYVENFADILNVPLISLEQETTQKVLSE